MTKKAFRKNTFMFRNDIALLTEIADRLLSSGDLIEDDAILVRQKQKDLRELVSAISKRHEKGLGPFPSNPPGVGYHGCSLLMNIAAILFGLGYQFESTKELAIAGFLRRGRDTLKEQLNAEDRDLLAACKDHGIDPQEWGAASKLRKKAGIETPERTLRRRLKMLPR